MKASRFFSSLAAVLMLLATTSGSHAAENYAVGSTVASFTAKDQHGKEFTFGPGARYLLLSFDMTSGKQANQKLHELGKDFLPKNQAVFVADIYGMPGIGRFFAMPKMRKYSHRIILADEKGFMDPFPKKADHVTVLTLDAEARITEVRYWNPEKEALTPLLVLKAE